MIGRVAIFSSRRMTKIKEYELPEPEAGALLMKVRLANICGSDLHVWEGKTTASPGLVQVTR